MTGRPTSCRPSWSAGMGWSTSAVGEPRRTGPTLPGRRWSRSRPTWAGRPDRRFDRSGSRCDAGADTSEGTPDEPDPIAGRPGRPRGPRPVPDVRRQPGGLHAALRPRRLPDRDRDRARAGPAARVAAGGLGRRGAGVRRRRAGPDRDRPDHDPLRRDPSRARHRPGSLRPDLLGGPDGELIAADWAEGFADAVRLRPEAWRPLLEDRWANILLTPITVLCDAPEDGSPLDPEVRAALRDEAADGIPVCVAGIHAFWKGRRGRPAAPARRVRSPKVGRNDPCPCGSGRKYKRCCGAN